MNYAVVIVNWNGAQDTIDCVASIAAASPQARIVLVDNGSTDGSVPRIVAALGALGLSLARVDLAVPSGPGDARVLLVEAGENLGFAAGSNLGLRVAAAAGLPQVVFLNNDTVVEPGALDLLVRRLQQDASCFASLPMITVHGRDTIWNCGGCIYAVGLRRYHLAGRPRREGARQAELRCSFFTGCCFAVRTSEFMARGGFTERFFFGEEDFELGMWMKDHGLRAVCLTAAVVQHKVSASFSQAAGHRAQSKVFLYYLNRFIHMRLRWGRARWWLWVAAYLPYAAVLLLKSHALPWQQLGGFVGALLRRARTMDGVTRQDFEQVMNGKWTQP